MAAEWASAPLDGLVDDILDRRGVTPLKLGSDFTCEGHRVISAKLIKGGRIDLSADEPRFVDKATYSKWMRTPLLPDDVILTSEAPLGEVAYITRSLEWCLGQRLFAIRTKKKRLHGRFLFYALQSHAVTHDLQCRATGTTAQGVRQVELRRVAIPLPPVDEQRAIAHILGTLDDKIELNRRMNETLEGIARAHFKSWFVDFDPVRAKAEGRDTGLPREVAELFPDGFEESELGEIPAGWTHRPFGELLVDSVGGDWGKESPDDICSHPVAVIRGTDLADVGIGGIGKVPVRYTTPARAKRRRLQDGDIVIEVSGGSPTQPTGRSLFITNGIIDRFSSDVVCASFCRRFRPKSFREGLLASLHLSLLYDAGGTWVYQNQSTGIANFQTTHFLETEKVVGPTTAVLEVFSRLVEPLARRKTTGESLTLTALRDTLLPKLLSGEIRVKQAERLVEEVM